MNRPDWRAHDLPRIRELVLSATTVDSDSVHGPTHWARVEVNGRLIADAVGADELVVTLFALFHDSLRWNDGHDPQHGSRAAELVRRERGQLQFVDDVQIELLCHACAHHTHEIHNDDLTIGACYDADRLDLGRVGITPRPEFLNSGFAREICSRRSFRAKTGE